MITIIIETCIVDIIIRIVDSMNRIVGATIKYVEEIVFCPE